MRVGDPKIYGSIKNNISVLSQMLNFLRKSNKYLRSREDSEAIKLMNTRLQNVNITLDVTRLDSKEICVSSHLISNMWEEIRMNILLLQQHKWVENLLSKDVNRVRKMMLRIRLLDSSRKANKLAHSVLLKSMKIWEVAFWVVVGHVPTDEEYKELKKLRLAVQKRMVSHSDSTLVWINKPGTDEKRGLNVPCYADRIIGKVILIVLGPLRDRVHVRTSSGFRLGFDRHKGMINFMNKITSPDQKFISADVRKCFDKITHIAMVKKIVQWKLPQGYETWAISSLRAGIYDTASKTTQYKTIGTPQGGVLSPLLCNEILHDVDRLIPSTEPYDRYADNLLFSAHLLESIKLELSKRGLEFKEEMMEYLEQGKSIVHLGCELTLTKAAKHLTVWYDLPEGSKYPTKKSKVGRIIYPTLERGHPNRWKLGTEGFAKGLNHFEEGKGTSQMDPIMCWNGSNAYAHAVNTSPNTRYVCENHKGKRTVLLWCGEAPYTDRTWVKGEINPKWINTNPFTQYAPK